MTPLPPPAASRRPAWRGRLAALGLSLAVHGAAAAAILLAVEDERPAPGGAISVEIVAALPGGGGPDARDAVEPEPAEPAQAETQAAETQEPRPEQARHEPPPAERVTPPPATPRAEPPAREPEARPAEPPLPAPERTEPKEPQPRRTKAPKPETSEARSAEPPRAKPAPDAAAARTLREAARPKLADRPAPAKAPERRRDPPAPRPPAEAGGRAGAAADTPQRAAVERTAPGFAVGSGANPLPDYPYRSRRRGQEGRVVLQVEVGPDGRPLAVRVRRSSGHDSLDEAALEAVRRWRFAPATLAGVAVAGSVEVPITFRLLAEGGGR